MGYHEDLVVPIKPLFDKSILVGILRRLLIEPRELSFLIRFSRHAFRNFNATGTLLKQPPAQGHSLPLHGFLHLLFYSISCLYFRATPAIYQSHHNTNTNATALLLLLVILTGLRSHVHGVTSLAACMRPNPSKGGLWRPRCTGAI